MAKIRNIIFALSLILSISAEEVYRSEKELDNLRNLNDHYLNALNSGEKSTDEIFNELKSTIRNDFGLSQEFDSLSDFLVYFMSHSLSCSSDDEKRTYEEIMKDLMEKEEEISKSLEMNPKRIIEQMMIIYKKKTVCLNSLYIRNVITIEQNSIKPLTIVKKHLDEFESKINQENDVSTHNNLVNEYNEL